MLAGVMYGIRDMRTTNRPDPGDPGPGQVKIRIRAVGLCGSDLHYYREGRIADAVIRKPAILGHEPAGEVVAVGAGARRFAVGDRVAIEAGIPCLQCAHCLSGRLNLCPNVLFLGGPDQDGVMCEYLNWPEFLIEKIPDGASMADGAMLEPLGVALHALDLAGLRPGETVAVLGVGSIGMCVIDLARANGATAIVATDPIEHRRAAGMRLGCAATFDSNEKGWEEKVRKALSGGADLTVECAGSAAAMGAVGSVTRRGGRAVIVGIPVEDTITFDPHLLRRAELTIYNCRRSNQALKRCVELLRTKRVNLAAMVSHTFPLSEVAEAFRVADEYRDGCLKIMVAP